MQVHCSCVQEAHSASSGSASVRRHSCPATKNLGLRGGWCTRLRCKRIVACEQDGAGGHGANERGQWKLVNPAKDCGSELRPLRAVKPPRGEPSGCGIDFLYLHHDQNGTILFRSPLDSRSNVVKGQVRKGQVISLSHAHAPRAPLALRGHVRLHAVRHEEAGV